MAVNKRIVVASVLVCASMVCAACTEMTDDGVTESAEETWYFERVGTAYTPPTEEEIIANPPEETEGLGELKVSIEEYISSRGGDWGVYVKDLKTNEYFSINEKPMSAASLIKLFTMAAVCNETESGTLEYDDGVKSNLTYMICESDNYACNYLTKRLGGGDTVHGFDVENGNTNSLGCRNTVHGSELVDERGGHVTFVTYNKTSPRDCGIILENVYRGTLVSKEKSDEMLELLKNQTRTWKIPASLPEGTDTANKTGENDTVEGDAAIVFSPANDYIICVIGNGSVGGGVETIGHISRMTYDFLTHNV